MSARDFNRQKKAVPADPALRVLGLSAPVQRRKQFCWFREIRPNGLQAKIPYLSINVAYCSQRSVVSTSI